MRTTRIHIGAAGPVQSRKCRISSEDEELEQIRNIDSMKHQNCSIEQQRVSKAKQGDNYKTYMSEYACISDRRCGIHGWPICGTGRTPRASIGKDRIHGSKDHGQN